MGLKDPGWEPVEVYPSTIINKPEILFPRIDTAKIEEEKKHLEFAAGQKFVGKKQS